MNASPTFWAASVSSALVGLLVASSGHATTYVVFPDGSGLYPTIQSAVDVAAPLGDDILLTNGTFVGPGNWFIDFLGKALTIHGNHPSLCVIDASQAGWAGIAFHSGEGPLSVLEGITFLGMTSPGDMPFSAISMENASPTLRHVVVRDCSLGAGQAFAIEAQGGAPSFEDCRVLENNAGGFAFYGSTATLTGCVIGPNSAAESDGGSIAIFGGSNVALRSTAVIRGGGILVGGASVSMEGCLVTENASRGLEVRGGTVTVARSTFAGNRAERGGGILATSGSISVASSVVWANCGSLGGAQIWTELGGHVSLTCSDVESTGIEGPGTVDIGAGVFSLDPAFCNPRSCLDSPSVVGLYSIPSGSPLRDVPGCGTLGALYEPCTVSVESVTWGQIKSQYRGNAR